ncbi:M23 family metallopeptidase [Teredinibacter franksiae]|uniref:M23 family metallopeptidase n=1 Tax=Teredinibacter franksiae TaxID=2761453 RepID=UPI001FE7DD34|nr:M23 family metallopeptidase [Teredinibacter franksiae]
MLNHYKKRSLWVSMLMVTALSCAFSGSWATDLVPLEVEGQWSPGGMLIGKTQAGARISVQGRELTADGHGRFVFGLGRDFEGNLELQVSAEGGIRTESFSVSSRTYELQRINGVAKKYVSPPENVLSRIRREAARIRKARETHSSLPYFAQPFIWPAEGPVTGVYGSQRIFNDVPKRPHYGLDIAGPVGTPIIAPASGVVTLVDNDMYYSGGTLLVDHGQGISSTFIHLSKVRVVVGQAVKQGELIAEMGATGRATGSHLDWRINWFDQRLDPYLLLPAKAETTPAK